MFSALQRATLSSSSSVGRRASALLLLLKQTQQQQKREIHRALMYLPAHDEKKARKAAASGVDCVCLDLEDAVAPNRKAEARVSAAKLLKEVSFGRSAVAVRINPSQTKEAKEDLAVLLHPDATLMHTLVVPKVESVDDLEWLFSVVEKALKNRKPRPFISLFTQVESAKGLLDLRHIIEFDKSEITESLILRHEGVIFGADDYAADIGAVRSVGNSEMLFARQYIVAHAKAYHMQAIDLVNINYKNPEELKKEAQEGFGMGFTGKQIIHPSQIEIVHEAFTPTPAQIAWAVRVTEASAAHEASGKGAFSLDDRMIDSPTVKQCQNIIALAIMAGKLPAPTAAPPPGSPAALAAAVAEAATKTGEGAGAAGAGAGGAGGAGGAAASPAAAGAAEAASPASSNTTTKQ